MNRLLLVALLFPLAEILLLVELARLTSGTFVFCWLLVAAVIGVGLMTQPSRVLWRQWTGRQVDPATLAQQSLGNRLIEILAGLLLLVPGVLSDLLAVALLFRPLRARVSRFALRRMGLDAMFDRSGARAESDPFDHAGPGETIDVASRPPRPST
jgi:UPF0716 protein FxsA